MSANNPNLAGAGGLSKRDSTLNGDLDGKSISDSYGDGRGSISDESDNEDQGGRRVLPAKRRKGDGDDLEDNDDDDDEEDEQSYRRPPTR